MTCHAIYEGSWIWVTSSQSNRAMLPWRFDPVPWPDHHHHGHQERIKFLRHMWHGRNSWFFPWDNWVQWKSMQFFYMLHIYLEHPKGRGQGYQGWFKLAPHNYFDDHNQMCWSIWRIYMCLCSAGWHWFSGQRGTSHTERWGNVTLNVPCPCVLVW